MVDQDVAQIIDLCLGLPMVPVDMLRDSLAIIKTKIDGVNHPLMKHALDVLVLNIEMLWINSPSRSYKFCVCGSSERTSYTM